MQTMFIKCEITNFKHISALIFNFVGYLKDIFQIKVYQYFNGGNYSHVIF